MLVGLGLTASTDMSASAWFMVCSAANRTAVTNRILRRTVGASCSAVLPALLALSPTLPALPLPPERSVRLARTCTMVARYAMRRRVPCKMTRKSNSSKMGTERNAWADEYRRGHVSQNLAVADDDALAVG